MGTVDLAGTSVPRWPDVPPPLDPLARSWTLLGLGSAAQPALAGWRVQALAAGAAVSLMPVDTCSDALAQLPAAMGQACVGWRLAVAASEADALQVRSRALALGAVGDEVLVHVTGAPVRRVLCAHCAVTTETPAPVAAVVCCVGCGRDLLVYHHLSRRLAAYLGYQADAEEADPVLTRSSA